MSQMKLEKKNVMMLPYVKIGASFHQYRFDLFLWGSVFVVLIWSVDVLKVLCADDN